VSRNHTSIDNASIPVSSDRPRGMCAVRMLLLIAWHIVLICSVWWLGVLYGEARRLDRLAELEARLVRELLNGEMPKYKNVEVLTGSYGQTVVVGSVDSVADLAELESLLRAFIGGYYVKRSLRVQALPDEKDALDAPNDSP
jgi:hypothetical protein